MKEWSDPARVAEQYATSNKLNARINLHARFSTNPMGWFPWVFEQISPTVNPLLPDNARILELGCGSGELWVKNADRVPCKWRLTLSDLSWGMVSQVVQAAARSINLSPALINAGAIPVANASLDSVIANHMLYYVADRAKSLADFRRVVKPGGYLFASTLGQNTHIELVELLEKFDPQLADEFRYDKRNFFSLENGKGEISQWFSRVNVSLYPDSLHITEAKPLVDYILSTRAVIAPAYYKKLTHHIQMLMDNRGGAIDITKVGGLITAC